MPKLTADTITDAEIRSLHAGAVKAGNHHLDMTCNLALGMPRTLPYDAPAEHKSMNLRLRQQAREARGECADAINAADLALTDGK